MLLYIKVKYVKPYETLYEQAMPTTQEELDCQKANLRKVAGATVQTIPAKWTNMTGLKNFFDSELEIALVTVDGKPHLEIRTVRKAGA